MRIVFIADARSPIALGWISHFVDSGHDVHIISTYPCSPEVLPRADIHQFPTAFSSFARATNNNLSKPDLKPSTNSKRLVNLRIPARSSLSMTVLPWLGSVDLYRYVSRARALINSLAPDVVHAMRIPFEGLLAAKATPARFPLMISVWGNDFTLFASRYRVIARQTRQAMQRADALHSDCRRDINLAIRDWGFEAKKPTIVLPSSGGIRLSIFHAENADSAIRDDLGIARDAPVIINPRGFRSYVRNDIFFQAIPQVLGSFPKAVFICSAMQGNPVAEKWVRRMRIRENVRLLPPVPHEQMADLFRLAHVAVSPSLHDGTPNTLLEAMACGCFPVAGDIESVREWITDGVNGLLCDPNDVESLAGAVECSLSDGALRARAKEHNAVLIRERAEYSQVMSRAEIFYFDIAKGFARSGVSRSVEA